MKTFLILLLAVAVASAAKTRTKRGTYTASLNDYVDRVIEQLQPFITNNNLDPISLPNVTQSFSVKPLLITYSGRLSLFDGLLSNLASVRRYGDITVTYADKVLNLDANIGVDSLGIDYRYQAKLIGISASGSAVGTITTIDLGASLNADLNTYTLGLESFAINSVKNVTVRLRGNALVDWLANIIIKIVVAIIKSDVITTLDSTVTATIDNLLANVNDVLASARG